LRQGDSEAVAEALKLIADESADASKRQQLIVLFGTLNQPTCVPVLLKVVKESRNDALRSAAIGSLQSYGNPDIGSSVLALYKDMPDQVREVAQSLLSSRRNWAEALLAAIDAGQIDGVIERLTDLRERGDRRCRFLATALSARAAAEADDVATARTLIGEVVETAREEGAVRPFLDEGFDIDDPALGGTGTTPARPGGGTAVAARALVEPLSDRELSVLRFLPSRMSNREIGAELFVSPNTVKSHLKAIYRKLGADGRDDAVRRARQHGLI
jgi:DNA-binding CsgD family transcriptional regulator